MAKTEFVLPTGDVVIPVSDYPSNPQSGDRIDFYDRSFVVVGEPKTVRRDTVVGPTWVRVVTVNAAGGVVNDPGPAPLASAGDGVPKTGKKATNSRAGKGVVAEAR